MALVTPARQLTKFDEPSILLVGHQVNDDVSSDEAVRAYLRRALEAAGGETKLARLCGFERGKVKAWFERDEGRVGIYGADLFTVRRAIGIPLDAYADSATMPKDIHTRIDQLQEAHDQLRQEFERFRMEVQAGLGARWLRDRNVADEDVAQALRDATINEESRPAHQP